jgi:ATP-binding cassette subfamily F protein 3
VGKTTLLRILAGLEEADSGAVRVHGAARLGLLQQQPEFAAGQTVWEAARSSLSELISLGREAELAAEALSRADGEDQRRSLEKRFDRLQAELHRRDGYNLDHRVERVLAGLGFPTEALQQPADQLSGGQQNRLLLAKLLLEEPDLMLLDEPSNHLDVEANEWLEDFLVESGQALIVVSHDRYFLDKVTARTLELYRGAVESFPGGFSAYRRQKAERLEVQRRTYQRQRIEIAKMEDFVRRHHYGQKHAQAEDRRKKLERLERVEPPREISAPPMGLPDPPRAGDVVLRAEHIAKAFERPLFEDLSFDLLRGEKWGVLGPNGCGKTTLLRCIVGQERVDAGRIVLGAGVSVGYFDQLLAALDEDALVIDVVGPDHKRFTEQQRRGLLARFGVTGDMAYQPVGSLSGGERNRVALAALAASEANLLLLDEPTNHLDLWARASLEKSLRRYAGTVLFVCHDRYFLNQVADHLLVAEAGRFRVIEGNYDAYLHLVGRGLASGESSLVDQRAARNTTSAPRPDRDKATRRRRKFPYRKAAELEVEILQRESRVEQLHEALASPDVLRDGQRVKQTKLELEEQRRALAQLYEHWEEAIEMN